MSRRPFRARTQTYARNRANENMLNYIKVFRTTGAALDSNTLRVSVSAVYKIYEGKARVWQLRDSGVLFVGEENFSSTTTNVAIPFDAGIPQRDDVLLVMADESDPDTVTRAFRVTNSDGGGLLRSMRLLTCTGYQGSRFWDDGIDAQPLVAP